MTLRSLPLSMRKTNLARLLARRPDGIFVAPFEQGEIGPDLFRAACNMGLEGLEDQATQAGHNPLTTKRHCIRGHRAVVRLAEKCRTYRARQQQDN